MFPQISLLSVSLGWIHRFPCNFSVNSDMNSQHPLCCLAASLPGYAMSITVGNAIKNRASNEEILTILKDVPNPNQEDDDG